MEVFRDFVKDANSHIITWEKGYQKDKWNDKAQYETGAIIRDKNKKGDQKLVHYRYQEGIWDKESNIRQIIVQVCDKNWKVLIELSIITDDLERDTKEIIGLMLKRWVQENDFKYMIKHFGLNQITSYAFTDYRALKDKIEDKIYICSRHKSLTREIQKQRAKLKTALLNQYQFDQKYGDKDDEQLSKKQKERKKRIETKTKALNKKLKTLEKERKDTPKFISKLEELIEQDIKKLDTDTKSFMDAIKMLARNMFYLTFQPFKEKYNNYRDDHVLFRQLTLSGGTITASDQGCKISLLPQMEYQPKVQKIIDKVLGQINANTPKMPDGSRVKIELELKA